jgi:hypothetical protein
MRVVSHLIFKNISEFGHSPSYNGAFRARARTSNAQHRGAEIKPAALGLYITFGLCTRAGLLRLYPPCPPPFPFFFDPPSFRSVFFPWLSGRKSFRRHRTRVSGRRVHRVHAARPMRRRAPVLIALRLALLLALFALLFAPPTPLAPLLFS